MISTIPSSCPLKCAPKISLDDFEAHQKTCINHVFSGNPHPEERSEVVLDDAVKAKRIQNTLLRGGRVDGFYIQWGKQYPMNGPFSIKDKVVTIFTLDGGGSADWEGEIDLKD